MAEIILDIVNVVKKFDDQDAVNNISLHIEKGEFLTLLGPSGCGKTTTLRMIAGFENPTSGTILLEGQHVENKQPNERNVNTVFQNYALFPHMNVYDNIAYSLKIKKVNKLEIRKRVNDMLDLVQLVGYEKRLPEQLSGGQRQRVAIARAVINNPKVLLLDEPLGALDLKLRKQMQVELKRLQKKLGITFVYVTHDQEEALNMSDRIAVMNNGVIEQIGTPKEIYKEPKTKFVASFIGESNIFDALVLKIDDDKAIIKFLDVSFTALNKNINEGDKICISIRPEDVKYSRLQSSFFTLKANIKEHTYVGSLIKTIAVLSNGQEILINDYDKDAELPEEGSDIYLGWNPRDMMIVSAAEESGNEKR